MTKEEILEKLKLLEIDKENFIILSGASLVMQGIIEKTKDIDLICSKEYYDSLDWPVRLGAFNIPIKYKDVFEIGYNLYQNCEYIVEDGYKIATLDYILKVKQSLNREKDIAIIKKLNLLTK